jgi:hypothetical protein
MKYVSSYMPFEPTDLSVSPYGSWITWKWSKLLSDQ